MLHTQHFLISLKHQPTAINTFVVIIADVVVIVFEEEVKQKKRNKKTKKIKANITFVWNSNRTFISIHAHS